MSKSENSITENATTTDPRHEVEVQITHRESQHIKVKQPGPEVKKLEYSLKLKIKRNGCLRADMCLHAANHCIILSLRMN